MIRHRRTRHNPEQKKIQVHAEADQDRGCCQPAEWAEHDYCRPVLYVPVYTTLNAL